MEEESKISEETIVIDLASVPAGWDVEKVLHFMKKTGILMVDSFKGGKMPFMLHPRKKMKFMIKDIRDEDRDTKK